MYLPSGACTMTCTVVSIVPCHVLMYQAHWPLYQLCTKPLYQLCIKPTGLCNSNVSRLCINYVPSPLHTGLCTIWSHLARPHSSLAKWRRSHPPPSTPPPSSTFLHPLSPPSNSWSWFSLGPSLWLFNFPLSLFQQKNKQYLQMIFFGKKLGLYT